MNSPADLTRRGFLHGTAAAGAMSSAAPLHSSSSAQAPGGAARVSVEGDSVVRVESSTLRATIDKGFLTSLRSKITGEEFIESADRTKFDALRLVYRASETVDIGEQIFGNITARQVSPLRAEILFSNWNGDGVITVSVDPDSGDLVVEPSANSSRPGIRSCRWTIPGLRKDLKLVAPFYQGVSLDLNDPLIRNSTWRWPQSWEAGLAILQARSSGFWIHTQDNRYRYKALAVGKDDDPYVIGLDTEAYGPIDNNLAAGGLAWRINVYQGDWKAPAERYRRWLWAAYDLAKEEQRRKPYIHKLGMAISWCPNDVAILDSLAQRVNPARVLIHFSNWRTDAYDENYPTYVANENAARFLARAMQAGFHVMPHFNSLETDPNHSVYAQMRDFQYRDVETKKIQGWSWVEGRSIGVPESNASRLKFRDKKVMTKIHPGLSLWRSVLCEQIRQAARQHSLETVFIDVTLVTGNLHNCLVEGLTATEGMNRLIHQVGALDSGLSVGGEGLNEIIFQGLCFAQVHLFRSSGRSIEGLERTGGCPLNDFLFGKLCRSFGYSGLGGRNPDEELRARIHEEHGALPTITIRSAREITDPTPAVKRALDSARG